MTWEHEPPPRFGEEGDPCFYTRVGSPCAGTLQYYPHGMECECGNPGAKPPCWNCVNSQLGCSICESRVVDIAWEHALKSYAKTKCT